MSGDQAAGIELLRTALQTEFHILTAEVREGLDPSMLFSQVELQIGDENEGEEDVAWAAFGFLFAVAALSFNDARPRGVSDRDFLDSDEFTVADFFGALRFERGTLQLSIDYLRGRCVKTDVAIRANGHVTIDTRGRGDAVLRWLDRIQGKQVLSVVPGAKADGGEVPG